MAVSHVLSNAVPDATGTMTIWFGATTATVAATDVIRPSDWNSAHNQYMTVAGNTVGQSTFSGTNIVIGGGANITLSGVNATRFDIVGGAGGGGGSVNISAGTTSNNLTALTFADGNGVSFGLNGSTITATVATNYLTTARASNDAIGLNTAQSNVTWTVNSNGLSLDARGYAGTNTTFNGANLSGSMTVNSNGVQLSLSAGNYLTSQSNQAFSAAGGSSAFQTLGFSDTNGVSFSNSNGSVVATVRTDYASSVHGHTATLLATSNTTQSSSGTANLNNLIFAGAGIASVGVTNGSVVVSVPAGGGAGDGGVFAGVSNLGNTAGSTGTVSTGNFVLVGTNGISLSQSTGAAGSAATVTVYQAPPLSDLALMPNLNFRATGVFNPAQNTMYLQPFVVPHDLSASIIAWQVALTNSSSAASSGQVGFTGKVAIYSQHSTDSKVLTLHSSTSVTLSASYSSNVSMRIGYFSSVVNSTSFGTSSSSSAGVNVSSLLHGDRMLMVPCGSLSVGNWWIAYAQSTSSAGTPGNILAVSRYGHSSQLNVIPGFATSATSASAFGNAFGLGPWSGNASTIPASLSFSEVMNSGFSMFPYQAIGAGRR